MSTIKQQLNAERDMPHATTDQLRAAAKRRAAAGVSEDPVEVRTEAPKGRRSRPSA